MSLWKQVCRITHIKGIIRRLNIIRLNICNQCRLLNRKRMDRNEKQVVFVVSHLSPRVVKIAYGLYKNGYEVIAICRRIEATNNLFLEQIREYCSEVYIYDLREQALAYALKYRPLLYHIFCCYSFDAAVYIMKKKIGKCVFDNYDGYKGFLLSADENAEQAEWEKYCLENADGLCCRSLESQYQRNKLGYRYKGKRILFLDYCWDSFKNVTTMPKNQLQFYYCGGIVSEKQYEDCAFACNLTIADILNRHGCDYTMYPSVAEGDFYSGYREADKKLPHFHFKSPVPYDKLIPLMGEGDYGMLLYKENYKDSEKNGYYYSVKYRYAATNKLFDYIDAGLPVLGSSPDLFFQYFKHYGMAYRSMLEELEQKLTNGELKNAVVQLKDNIRRNRREMSVMEQIPRLIAFYHRI